MGDLNVWFKDAAGNYAGELHVAGASDKLPQLVTDAGKNGQTVVDQSAPGAVRPPSPAPIADPLKATYAGAVTTDAKVDVIAQRLGLK